VNSAKIKNWTIKTEDLAPGIVTEAKLAQALLERINQLESRIAYLEAKNLEQEEILSYFSIVDLHDESTGEDYPTVRISFANLQVVNGEGTTDSANGLGNIIVGYNQATSLLYRCSLPVEERYDDEDQYHQACIDAGGVFATMHRGGSHNLVTGEGNSYSSFGGLIAGVYNTVNNRYSSITGGYQSIASGPFSSVSGGFENWAIGLGSSVSGGVENTASGSGSSISGGTLNIASEAYSSVSGGAVNTASGGYSSVSGGHSNTAIGNFSSISGGEGCIGSIDHSWGVGDTVDGAGCVFNNLP
jgi:hypothetical protein